MEGSFMAIMSICLPDELADQLKDLAETTGRTKNFLAVQALRNFIEQEAWQVAEIKKAIAEADAGDFATDEEMRELDAKWGYHAD